MPKWFPDKGTHEITCHAETGEIVAIIRIDLLQDLYMDLDAMLDDTIPKQSFDVVMINNMGYGLKMVQAGQFVPAVDMRSSDPSEWRLV